MVLFFIGYQSELLNRPERIKVEINFVDKTLYPLEKKVLQSYIEGIGSEKIEFLYKDQWKEYTTKIQLDCYTPEEIFVEKCRAAMTRRTYKLRDMIDIYFIEENYGITVEDCREKIIEKTNFMLDLYGRYRENIRNKIFPRPDRYNEEMDLMIIEIPKDLIPSIKRIHEDLKEVKDSII